MVLADAETDGRLADLVDENTDPLLLTDDRPDERQLELLGLRRFGRRGQGHATGGATITGGGGRRDAENKGRSRVAESELSGIGPGGPTITSSPAALLAAGMGLRSELGAAAEGSIAPLPAGGWASGAEFCA